MAGTTMDWTLARVYGAPIHATTDGYSSDVLLIRTQISHTILRGNTLYELKVTGDDGYVVLLSDRDVSDGDDLTIQNSLLITDGDTQIITTTRKPGPKVDGQNTDKIILAARSATVDASLRVTIKDSRAGR